MNIILTEDRMLYEGSLLTKSPHTNNNNQQEAALRRFTSFFGATPIICAMVWNILSQKKLHPLASRPLYLLCAFLFLRQYSVETINHAITGLDEKTFRKWCWTYIHLMAFELNLIHFDGRFRGAHAGDSCFMSVDCTDCRIAEPSPFSPKWYSHKFKGSGLRYEIAVGVRNGLIVWVYGGRPCGEVDDLSVAREQLVHRLLPNEKIVADNGYRDGTIFIYSQNRPESARFIKEILARHETVNRCFKRFNILNHHFRHALEKHHWCFYAVANIVQLILAYERPLYMIDI